MEIQRFPNKNNLNERVAVLIGHCIRQQIEKRGKSVLAISGDPSLKGCLDKLKMQWGVDWSKVTVFQMTEYEGCAPNNPKSQHHFLKENLFSKLPTDPTVHYLDGSKDLASEGGKLAALISNEHVDCVVCELGATGRLGANEPPADFTTSDSPYVTASLSAETVSQLGISSNRVVTIPPMQLMKAGALIVAAAGGKACAPAVKQLLDNQGTNAEQPVSILRQCGSSLSGQTGVLLLDVEAAAELTSAHSEQVDDFLLSPRAGLPEFRHFGSGQISTVAPDYSAATGEMTAESKQPPASAAASTTTSTKVVSPGRERGGSSVMCADCGERPSQISVMIGGKRRPLCRPCLKNPMGKKK